MRELVRDEEIFARVIEIGAAVPFAHHRQLRHLLRRAARDQHLRVRVCGNGTPARSSKNSSISGVCRNVLQLLGVTSQGRAARYRIVFSIEGPEVSSMTATPLTDGAVITVEYEEAAGTYSPNHLTYLTHSIMTK
jgi:hypothetical protein